MTLPPPKICRRIRKLHAMLLGSPHEGERNSAREKLQQVLVEYGLTWNDMPGLLAADIPEAPRAAPPRPAPSDKPEVNVLDLVDRLIELHIALTSEQRLAVSLWLLHTYVFGRFRHTPRLALLSPVRGCGKTTLLVLLELLACDPYRSENATAAAIYHAIATREHTMLLDEGDNLGLEFNKTLRSILNANRRGDALSRFVSGRSQKFPLFIPFAIAAIGVLPLPLMQRAIIIQMQRVPGEVRLQQLDDQDPTTLAQFTAARSEIEKWVATCALSNHPEMPKGLHGRAADNWRPVLAIADDLGHGDQARAAALALTRHLEEDVAVILLTDIHAIFNTLGVDRITSAALVDALIELDDGLWHDWRGPKDDRPPHKLSQAELALLLRPFAIRPRTVWPVARQPESRSRRGYLRSQFEVAWRSYCPPDTPTQSNKIHYLHGR